MAVQDLGDAGDWTATPVVGNPFSDVPDLGVTRNRGFSGHIAANPKGFSQIDQMVREGNRDNPAPASAPPPEQQYYGGRYGAALEHGFQNVAGGIGSAIGSATDLAGQGVGSVASAAGVPNAEGLGRSVTQMLDSPIHGPSPGGAAHAAAGLGDLHSYVPAAVFGINALTADRGALRKAKALSLIGRSSEDIRNKTNWYKDEQGKWGFEVPDTGVQYSEDPNAQVVGDVLHAPHIAAAYPGLMKTPLVYDPAIPPSGGMYAYPTHAKVPGVREPFGEIALGPNQPNAGTPLHESHHWIAHHEDFAPGHTGERPLPTDPTYPIYQGYVNDTFNALDKPSSDLGEFQRAVGANSPAQAQTLYNMLPTLTPEKKAQLAETVGKWRYYNSTLGEAHARNVSNRYQNPALYSKPFGQTYDVPKLTLPPYAEGGRVGFADGGKTHDYLNTDLIAKAREFENMGLSPEEMDGQLMSHGFDHGAVSKLREFTNMGVTNEAEIRGQLLSAGHELTPIPYREPMTSPPVVTRPPSGLMSQEGAAMRQREGFEPPSEWTGGRVGFQDGGDVEGLEAVHGNPFENMSATLSARPVEPPDRTMTRADYDRARFGIEPPSDMHRRISEASQDDPSITARGGYRPPMNSADILAGGAGPVQSVRPYEDPTFSGQVGTAMEHGAERLGAPMSVVRSAGDIGRDVADFSGLDLPHHAQQAVLAAKHGDYGYAAGEALGAIPVIPGAAGVKWEAGKALKAAQAAGKDSRVAAINTIRDAQQTQLNRDIDGLSQYTPVPAAGRRPPTGSQNTSAAIRDLPSIEGQIAKAETDPHLIRDTDPTSASYYVGGPTTVKKPADLTALRRQNYGYLASMPEGSDWYDRYRAILRELHGDTPPSGNAVPAGTWSAKMEGQWSAQRPPSTEFGMAQKERSGAIAGMPQRANTGAQHEAFNRALEAGDPNELQLGNKTREYAQLIEPSRGLLPPQATGVNDFRYATQWGYREPDGSPWDRALSDAQHRFVDNETARMVKWANDNRIGGKTDWTGEQVQAAIWVRQKAEQELRDSPGHVEQHLSSMSPQEAYEKAFKEHAFPMGNATIEEHLPKYTTYTTHEAQPGLEPGARGHLPDAAQMTDAERQQWKDNPLSSWLSPEGHDRMYSGLGAAGNPQVAMMTRPGGPSLGKFETSAGIEYNPATTGRVVTGLGGAEGEEEAKQEFNPADRAIFEGGETLRAAMDAQNASAAHRIFKGGSPKDMDSVEIPIKNATREQLHDLERIGGPHGLNDAIDRGPDGVVLTHKFGHPKPDLGGKSWRAIQNDLKAGGYSIDNEARGKKDVIYQSLEDAWRAGIGSGQVTDAVLQSISRSPELREAFAQNPYLAEIARNRIMRDTAAAPTQGGQNLDIHNFRTVIAMRKNWPDLLEQARKHGLKALAPAAAAAGLTLYPEAGLPAEIGQPANSNR